MSNPASGRQKYTSKELSRKTWPDLARLFERPEIGDAWWWCTFHHISSFSQPENKPARTRAERAVRNRREKEKLVKSDQAHGVIVYAKGEPVGWCQYGPREELSRIDHSRNYRNLTPTDQTRKLWRITCFVVDKNYRKSGVASTALKAALESILFLVVIPQLALGKISQADQTTITQYTGINLATFITGLNIFGIALSALSAVQSWAHKWSIIKPVSSSLHMITSFVLMLYVIGIGNVSTFGVTNLNYLSSDAKLNITLNLTLTFLTIMVGAAVALKVIQKTMKWREDVGFHRLDLQAGVQPLQTPSTGPSPR